ncbi:flagellin N-terminal helical domain-containing protein [Mediterraneibacter glycyrrhizinilyticus]|uniref:flagellin N-terminal helical domain-containing protein n=1 Tax=Mediterraneibacter glycyrrhizinilyticus TaxID=342942 RepID=UPI00189FFCEC|nr:flagellin [Mediterraneibacter glycyrrhizinilyticus]
MRIQHNIAALNSYRNLTGNNNAVAKNLEKLSSGYRINRAGDDAAGLAISEKMRAQITGLNTAQKNAQDGVSLVQTAEGALTEVHSMLNRMVELADQSANGTYDNPVDRANLQKEIASLKDEIDRIADSTNFNGINLLDGSLSTTKLDLAAGTLGGQATTVKEIPATGTTSGIAGHDKAAIGEHTLTVEYADENGTLHKVDVKYKIDTADDKGKAIDAILKAVSQNDTLSSVFNITKDADSVNFESKVTGSKGAKVVNVSTTDATSKMDADKAIDGENAKVQTQGAGAKIAEGDTITLNGKTYEFVKDASTEPTKKGATAVVVGADNNATLGNLNKALESAGIKAEYNTNDIVFSATKNGAGLTLQIGDTSADFNQMTVSVGDMHTAALGIADIDISTQAGAKAAVDKIKSAINSVSSTRGDLGAIQNRLEHTINNLSVTAENMTAAESRIRDVDMANEMMAYTKNNILVQSSQAMLAQANQLPQGVLQLLQ